MQNDGFDVNIVPDFMGEYSYTCLQTIMRWSFVVCAIWHSKEPEYSPLKSGTIFLHFAQQDREDVRPRDHSKVQTRETTKRRRYGRKKSTADNVVIDGGESEFIMIYVDDSDHQGSVSSVV